MSVYNTIDPAEDESHQVISSFFLGPKAENYDFFQKRLADIFEAQRDARLDYFPKDGIFITPEVQSSAAYRRSTRKMTDAVRQASRLLASQSIPFWSPRYQGHMCCDVSMPAVLGYFMTMLYNPNNVAFEASPITTVVELEVGQQLSKLFGYNIDAENRELPEAWGHITCDGTVANLEGLWVARNLKFYPLSIRSAMKEGGPLAFIAKDFVVETCSGPEKLFHDLSVWELLNLKPTTILDIPERLYSQYYISSQFLNDVMKKYGIQSTGKQTLQEEFNVPTPHAFVAYTKHYSWPKSAAIAGIGSDNVVGIKVDHAARLDIDDLQAKLQESLDKKRPVYAVVAVIGTTEDGAVDPLCGIMRLRKEFLKKGLSFVVHADAAWGGYFCAMLPQESPTGVPFQSPSERARTGFVPDSSLREETQDELFMLREVDLITVDPHKAGYVPYPAGALCYRDGRMRFQITWSAPYLSRGVVAAGTSIGVFGVEGSKPGAAPMAAWLSHKCIGLGPESYGQLLGEVTFTCSRMAAGWAAMSTEEDPYVIVPLSELPSELAEDSTPEKVKAEKQRIRDQILFKTNEEIVNEDASRPENDKTMALLRALGSDLNINVLSTNWRYADGRLNDEVEEANYLNQRIIQRFSVDSPDDKPTAIPLYLSSTIFKIEEYGECAQHFKKRLGLYPDHVDLFVLRNVVMSPWPTGGNFLVQLGREFKSALKEEVEVCRKRNDTSPRKHEFLLQGTEKVYIILFPRFHLEAQRRQLIIEVKFPKDVMEKYEKVKKDDPSALFVLETADGHDISIHSLLAKKGFTTNIRGLGRRNQDMVIATDFFTEIVSTLKDRSLRNRHNDRSWPRDFVPFYLYGTANSLNLDHILVRCPNIQLSAENVQLSISQRGSDSVRGKDDSHLGTGWALAEKAGVFGKSSGHHSHHDQKGHESKAATSDHGSIPAETLAKGAILVFEGIREAAMQPFQSTKGPLGETLGSDSNFFFRPGQEFDVTVYEDGNAPDAPGPGLADVSASKELGKGRLKLGQALYVDSVEINKDPFEQIDGVERYKAWKAKLDSIGKELE